MMRCWRAMFLAVLLTACLPGGDNTVPPDLRAALIGGWHQADGDGRLYFYDDDTVKVNIPRQDKPAIRLLSTYEMLKDGQIGITVEEWAGPIVCKPDDEKKSMTVRLPDDEKHPMTFRKK